jgi:hypothetical protein
MLPTSVVLPWARCRKTGWEAWLQVFVWIMFLLHFSTVLGLPLFLNKNVYRRSYETVTEPRMTEPWKTEPRKTERRKTEPQKTECRKGPNLEWDRTSKDWTSNGTEHRKTERQMGPNIKRLNVERPNLAWDRTSKSKWTEHWKTEHRTITLFYYNWADSPCTVQFTLVQRFFTLAQVV